MINKYAEIQKRAVLYKAAKYIYRVKEALSYQDVWNVGERSDMYRTYGDYIPVEYSEAGKDAFLTGGRSAKAIGRANAAGYLRQALPYDARTIANMSNGEVLDLPITTKYVSWQEGVDPSRLRAINREGNRRFLDAGRLENGTHAFEPNFNSSMTRRYYELYKKDPKLAEKFYNRARNLRSMSNTADYFDRAFTGDHGRSLFKHFAGGNYDTASRMNGMPIYDKMDKIVADIKNGNIAAHKDTLDKLFGRGVADRLQQAYGRVTNKARWGELVDKRYGKLSDQYMQVYNQEAAARAQAAQAVKETVPPPKNVPANNTVSTQSSTTQATTQPTTTQSRTTTPSRTSAPAPKAPSATTKVPNSFFKNKWLLPAALVAAPLAIGGGYYMANRDSQTHGAATPGIGAFGQAALDRMRN